MIPIAEEHLEAAQAVEARLHQDRIRVHVDGRNETLNYRIRDGEVNKVPYMAVVGQREADAGTVAVRVRGAGKKQEVLSVEDFAARLNNQIRERALVPYGS